MTYPTYYYCLIYLIYTPHSHSRTLSLSTSYSRCFLLYSHRCHSLLSALTLYLLSPLLTNRAIHPTMTISHILDISTCSHVSVYSCTSGMRMLCTPYKTYDRIPTKCTYLILHDTVGMMLLIGITQIIVRYKLLVYSFVFFCDLFLSDLSDCYYFLSDR